MNSKQIKLPLSFHDFKGLEITKDNIIHFRCMTLATIKYEDKSIYIGTDNILITSYGIPQIGSFCRSDRERSYIKIGFDPYQSSCTELENFLLSIDNLLSSDEIKSTLFGENKQNYKYNPIVRRKDDLLNYCKIKLKTGGKNATEIINDDKRINVFTISDIANCVKFRTNNRFVIGFQHIWMNKNRSLADGKCSYGVSLSMIRIECNPKRYPITMAYDKESLKKAYKKYMDEKKKSIPRCLQIEV